jgi:hypothetical protein
MAAEIPSELIAIYPYVGALLYTASISIMYRHNIFFNSVESMVLGFATAHDLVFNLDMFRMQVIDPIAGGNIVRIASVILAVMYLAFFSRRTFEAYRFTLSLFLVGVIGRNVVTQMGGTWSVIQDTAQVTDLISAGIFISTIFTITYFIYGRRYSRTLSIPRTIALWILYVYLGTGLAPSFLRFLERTIYYALLIAAGPGIWIVFGGIALIFLDAVLGISKRISVPAS